MFGRSVFQFTSCSISSFCNWTILFGVTPQTGTGEKKQWKVIFTLSLGI